MTTALYAALLTIIFIVLSVHIIRWRRKYRVAIGDGGDHEMKRRVRAHSNFLEYTLFFLILLGYAEINGLPPYAVHCLGVVFIIGRCMHAYSLLKAEQYVNGVITAYPLWRMWGMICTFSCLAVLSALLVVQYVGHVFS